MPAPSATSASSGTTVSRTTRERNSPTSSTTSAPPSVARIGDSAAQSMVGASGVTA